MSTEQQAKKAAAAEPNPKARAKAGGDGAGPAAAAKANGDAPASLLRPLVEDLLARRAQIALGGGAEGTARQHAQDKLTARERLALLIDTDSDTGDSTFTEM